jgi:hypothetical protein
MLLRAVEAAETQLTFAKGDFVEKKDWKRMQLLVRSDYSNFSIRNWEHDKAL